MFCPQTFDTAAAKDDHVLEHFAQETCVDCNRNLIRIGGSLYTKHDAAICSIRTPKSETTVEPHSSLALAENDVFIQHASIEIEQQDIADDSSESIDFDVWDKLDKVSSTDSEDDNHSIASDVEMKLQEMFCKEETIIDTEQATEKFVNESIDAENALDITDEYEPEANERDKQRITNNWQENGGFQCDLCGHATKKKVNVDNFLNAA